MAKKTPAQRAKKKHQKDIKRKKKLAARGPAAPAVLTPPNPLTGWHPATEGIAGLAKRFAISGHIAARVAEARVTRPGYAGGEMLWIPSRVSALTTEEILAGLAARGVHTDERAFLVLAAEHTGGRAIAATWLADLAGTVHDHDFVGQAAEELWARWNGDVPSDEDLADQWDAGLMAYEGGDPEEAVEEWVGLWTELSATGGIARYRRLGLVSVEVWLSNILNAIFGIEPALAARGADVVLAVRDAAGLTLSYDDTASTALALEQAERYDEAFELMYAMAERGIAERDMYDFLDYSANFEGATVAMMDRLIAVTASWTGEDAEALRGVLQERREDLAGADE